jgi:putative ABC transport system permease protein
VTLIVAGVGIMNIMLVAVAERTREIGIRKALGARPSVILLQFLVEAGLVSLSGGAIGTTLGLLMSRGIAAVTPLPAAVPAAGVAIGLGFGLLVGLSFGFLPALRAARLLPVDALSAGG